MKQIFFIAIMLLMSLIPDMILAQSEFDNRLTSIASKGAELLEERCTGCHDLERAYEEVYTYPQWEDVVDRMIRKGGDDLLDETERKIVIDYLTTYSQLETFPQQPPPPPENTESEIIYVEDEQEESSSLIVTLLGRSHVLLLHFPIALIYLLVLVEIFSFSPTSSTPTVNNLLRKILITTVILSIFATISGLIFVGERQHPLLSFHKNMGIVTTVFVFLMLIIRILDLNYTQQQSQLRYRILLIISLILVTITAHVGGTMVHGDLFEPILGPIEDLIKTFTQ